MKSPDQNLIPSDPDSEQIRIFELWNELRKNQVITLNEAGKRIIELSTGMLGIFLLAIAFGEVFPPPYLSNVFVQISAIAALIFFFLSLLTGFLCVQPQEYPDYLNNLTEMERTLMQHNRWKAAWFRVGSILFGLGALWFAAMVIAIILSVTPS